MRPPKPSVWRWPDHWFFIPRTAGARWSGDLVLAAAVVADAWPHLSVHAWAPNTPDHHHLFVFLVLLVSLVAVRIRHERPLPAFLLTLPGLCAGQELAASGIVLCALARRRPDRRVLVAATAALALGSLSRWHATRGDLLGLLTPRELVQHTLYAFLIGGAPVAIGLLHHARQDLTDRITELDALREQESRRLQHDAVNRERAHISREMHDVVSHKAGLIAVQAGALELTALDAATRSTARTVRTLAVSTLEELRSILLVLRDDDARAGAPLVPQKSLADLPPLVAHSGIDAALHIGQEVTGLSAAAQCTVYRTVQEGLTNARKHAPGAPATVRVDVDGSGLTAIIRNPSPAGSRRTPLPGAGWGLVGLRERAALLGGRLDAGPLPDGGFQVVLTLPRPTPLP
ncbi:sensor histidine kinase [Streptomyces sp. NPDC059917]|uniref:sensor histidine kinase n=1 Tax=Streptomyces sp. NPDC059917 TaxID=3347002 RepID=UPI00365430F7